VGIAGGPGPIVTITRGLDRGILVEEADHPLSDVVQVARGTIANAERESVAAYLERWITSRELAGKVRPKTAGVYRGYVRREIGPRIGSMRLSDVRPIHVQRVLDEGSKRGPSARSVGQVHAIMHGAFRTAVRLQVLSVNPSDGVTPPELKAPKLTIPAATDVARLLAAVDPNYRAPLALAAGTGARRGEELGLRWPSVELDAVDSEGRPRPRLRVEGTLQRANGKLVVLTPKTERSKRTIPLPATLAALRRVKTEQNERRLLAGPAWNLGEYVFDRGDGRPIDPDAFGKAFRTPAKPRSSTA
jgi:integrase